MMAARESSGRASDVSESDEDGEGGMDSEEEELPDHEAPLTDQQKMCQEIGKGLCLLWNLQERAKELAELQKSFAFHLI